MNRTKISIAGLLWLASLGCILLATSAGAQRFQAEDGGTSIESGRGGVAPYPGGYYSVGHTQSVGATADVYVVQTDVNGVVINGWTYNFGGQDYGIDIHRCGNGDYAITGVTNANGSNDMFIMRIDPAGALVWARTIGTPNDDVGVDVMQAGNGDIIAAGWGNGVAGNREGLLVRLGGAGGLGMGVTFSRLYTPAAGPNNDDYFHGLWVAGNGDLLVCGGTNSFGNTYQGWAMRTSPAGIPLWSNHLGGGNSNEQFHSITQLTVGAQAGNIVTVGSTNLLGPLDFYLVKLAAGGAFIADLTGGLAPSSEAIFQIRENLTFNAGTLLLAGSQNPGPLGMEDGYVIEMGSVWNCAAGIWRIWSKNYGGDGNDRLYSAQEVPTNCFPGFIMCGLTASPDIIGADPQQHFLIKTDNAGASGCNEALAEENCAQPNFPIAPAGFAWPAGPVPVVKTPPMVDMDDGNVCCFTPCPPLPPPAKGNISGTGSLMKTLAAAFPNPVTAGSDVQVPYLLSEDAEAAIAVSDMAGRIVYTGTQQASAGAGNLEISTEGWAAGVYAVRIDLGGDTQAQRIVVMDK